MDPDHPSVTVTFTLAFEKVAAANELAANLVRACAFLSPDAIPVYNENKVFKFEWLEGLILRW